MTLFWRAILLSPLLSGVLMVPAHADPGFGGSAGLGVGFAPAYPGADEYKAGAAAFVDLRYGLGNRMNSSIGFDGKLTFTIGETERSRFGVGLGYGGGRDSDDADRLAGLPDIDDGATLHGFVTHDLSDAVALSAEVTGFTGGTEGMEATLGLSRAVVLSERSAVRLGVSATWSNGERAQGLYGLTAVQAEASAVGLAPFEADAGVTSVDLSATLTHRVTERVTAVAILGVTGLTGSAADSPLTENRVNPSLGLGVVRAF